MLASSFCSHPCKGHIQLVIVSTLTELVNAWLTYFTGLYFVVKEEERRKAGKCIILVQLWLSLHVQILALQLQTCVFGNLYSADLISWHFWYFTTSAFLYPDLAKLPALYHFHLENQDYVT